MQDVSKKIEDLPELKTKEILGGIKHNKKMPEKKLVDKKEFGLSKVGLKRVSKKDEVVEKKEFGFNPLGDLMDVVQENVLDIKEGVDEGVQEVVNKRD